MISPCQSLPSGEKAASEKCLYRHYWHANEPVLKNIMLCSSKHCLLT